MMICIYGVGYSRMSADCIAVNSLPIEIG